MVHVKSTGTTDLKLATQRAEDFHTDLLIARRSGGVVSDAGNILRCDRRYRFDVVADAFLDSLKRGVGDDERRRQRYRDHRAILMADNGLCRFFKGADVRTITTNKVKDFLLFAEMHSRHGNLRPTTKRNMLSTLRPVLDYAVDDNRLDRVPKMPSVPMKDNPRSSFTRAELSQMEATCRRLADKALTDVDRDAWLELHDFIVFMIATFLRPSEWVELTQANIEVVNDGRTPHLKIALSRGKTGKRLVGSMPEAVQAYARMVERNGADPSAFIFLPARTSRDSALGWMRKRFAALLQQCGLENDRLGSKRVIYSLRHTALSLRLVEGDHVDLIMLARNAGTSVEMLERFYTSRVSALDNLENLQSRRASLRVKGTWGLAFDAMRGSRREKSPAPGRIERLFSESS